MKKITFFLSALLMTVAASAASPKVVMEFNSQAAMNAWNFTETSTYINHDTIFTNGTYSIKMVWSGVEKEGCKMTVSKTDTAIIFGKKNAALVLPKFDFAVAKIVTYGAASASGSTIMNVFVGDKEVSTATTGCKVSNTYMIASDYQAAGNIYSLKITSAHNAQISKIEIYEAVAGAPELPTYSVASGIYAEAQKVGITCATAGAEIRYTLDGSVPTATSDLYTDSLLISATTTINAIAIANGIASESVACTLKIISLEGAGTKEDPFTVADVMALENSRKEKAWVQGFIIGSAATGGKLAADTVTSNILLATSVEDSIGVPVALPSGSTVGKALNLPAHSNYIGAEVRVYGSLEAYFSTTGVKSPSDYEIVFVPEISIHDALNEVKKQQPQAHKVLRNGRIYIVRDGMYINALGVRE